MEIVQQRNTSYRILDLYDEGGAVPSPESAGGAGDIHLSYHNVNVAGPPLGHPSSTPDTDYFEFILYSVVIPSIFGLITFVGLVGNLLVMHVIRARKKMQTVTNLLLLNLAVADLSFVAICPPFTAYQMATNTWPFPGFVGDLVCKLMHYLLNVTSYVTIYTLVLISVIRYLTVVHNARTVALRTKQNTLAMVIMIWFVMLAVNIPIPLSYGVQDIEGMIICDNYAVEIGQKLYATFFVFAYLLPLCVIAIFSICILRHIRQHQPTTINKKSSKSTQKKRQVTQLIILVIVIFAIFWLPIHIHLLVAYYSSIPDTRFYKCISVFWNVLAYCNSCVNPIIYNYTSKDFRDSFRETVCCVKAADWERGGDGKGASFVTKVEGKSPKHQDVSTNTPTHKIIKAPSSSTKATVIANPIATQTPPKTMVVESANNNINTDTEDNQEAYAV